MPRAIDADALISKIAFHRDSLKPYNVVAVSAFDAVIDFIKRRPTISPDEVRGVGKWEQKEIYGAEETTIEQMQSACCSVCGKYHTTPFSYYFSKYNYCPNCGAKMEVSEDA